MLIEREAMRDHSPEIHSPRGDDVHEAAHAFLAAGAERGDDPGVAKARGEGIERDAQVGRIDTEARQRPARPQDAQRALECGLRAQSLNGDIDAAAVGQSHDRLDRISLLEIDGVVHAERPRHGEPFGDAVDADDRGGAHQPGSRRGTQADRPQREHRHDVADADATAFGAGEAGRHDVRTHQYLLVGQGSRHRREIGHGVGHQHELGLAAVDGVAELPAAHRLEAVTCAGAVLRGLAAQAGIAVAARRDGANDDPLALFVVRYGGTKLFDDADRLVPDGQAFADGILALEDVNIGAADRGRGDAHQRVQGTDVGYGLGFENDAAGLNEDRGFHPGHGLSSKDAQGGDGASGYLNPRYPRTKRTMTIAPTHQMMLFIACSCVGDRFYRWIARPRDCLGGEGVRGGPEGSDRSRVRLLQGEIRRTAR